MGLEAELLGCVYVGAALVALGAVAVLADRRRGRARRIAARREACRRRLVEMGLYSSDYHQGESDANSGRDSSSDHRA